jgi:hypothetical protein
MKIDNETLARQWWENDKGERWTPSAGVVTPPEGFDRRVTEQPLVLHRQVQAKQSVVDEMTSPQYASGYSADLVLALARPSIAEAGRALQRALLNRRMAPAALDNLSGRLSSYGLPADAVSQVPLPQRFALADAILIAARACERCTNALAYAYGLQWGYHEGSDHWNNCKARCGFCSKEV